MFHRDVHVAPARARLEVPLGLRQVPLGTQQLPFVRLHKLSLWDLNMWAGLEPPHPPLNKPLTALGCV